MYFWAGNSVYSILFWGENEFKPCPDCYPLKLNSNSLTIQIDLTFSYGDTPPGVTPLPF